MTPKTLPPVIWMRAARGSRGPQPSRDREELTRVAITIADREGMGAVSMRRIAAELGTGTSSLYRYLARKDDLVNLMVDGALEGGEVRSTGDWRADLETAAQGLRGLFKAHPWLGTALAGRPTLGPHRLRALEATLALLEPTGRSMSERLVAIDALTSYVRGFVASETASECAIGESSLSTEQWWADQAAYTEHIIRSGLYPRTNELLGAMAASPVASMQDSSFESGLAIVLDGIALRLAQ